MNKIYMLIFIIVIIVLIITILMFWLNKYYEFKKYKIKEFNKYALKNNVDTENLLFYSIWLRYIILNKITDEQIENYHSLIEKKQKNTDSEQN